MPVYLSINTPKSILRAVAKLSPLFGNEGFGIV